MKINRQELLRIFLAGLATVTFAGVVVADGISLKSGQWQHATKPGTGIDLLEYPPDAQHPDGLILARWYGFDRDRELAWMIAQGTPGNPFTELRAFSVFQDGNGEVTEYECGEFTLEQRESDLLSVAFIHRSSCIIPSFDHEMIPLYTPAAEEEPQEPPEPQTPITLRAKIGSNIWRTYEPPLAGTSETSVGSTQKTWIQVEIKVLEGKLTISSVSKSGPHNPKITGISAGQVFTKGSTINFSLKIGPRTAGAGPGNFDLSNFKIQTRELGLIVNETAMVWAD